METQQTPRAAIRWLILVLLAGCGSSVDSATAPRDERQATAAAALESGASAKDIETRARGEGAQRRRFMAEALWAGANRGDMFDYSNDRIEKMLQGMRRSNLRVARIIVDDRLEMDDSGEPLPAGTYNACMVDAIDYLMTAAERNGVALEITLQAYNWISGSPFKSSRDDSEWRKCKTPLRSYLISMVTGETQYSYSPYFTRGWTSGYLVDEAPRAAYKQRVSFLLNHVNPYTQKAWKDMDDVVWAWGLQSEPEYLDEDPAHLGAWFNEMADYVKRLDPNTYVALGTKSFDERLANIANADIYTAHLYYQDVSEEASLGAFLDDKRAKIGAAYRKLLLIEEFNAFANRPFGHCAGNFHRERAFENAVATFRDHGFPWMLWELSDDFDEDDLWFASGWYHDSERSPYWVLYPDGVLWGAKLVPQATALNTSLWFWGGVGKRWNVNDMTNDLCDAGGAACAIDERSTRLLDNFDGATLPSSYGVFDQGVPDVVTVQSGYLHIEAQVGQDLWGGSPAKRGAPLVLTAAPAGEYQVDTEVEAERTAREGWGPQGEEWARPLQPINTQMGLFVFESVDDWLFFGLTNHLLDDGTRGDGFIVTKTIGGVSSIVAQRPYDLDWAFLRVVRRGPTFTFYARSEYGAEWTLIASVDGVDLGEHQVGMGVKSFDVASRFAPGKANFDYFLIQK